MAGLHYEEFEIGHIFHHATTRTVTETDNLLMTTLSMNTQPLHLDAEFASKTEFGRPLVNSMFTLALVVGLSVTETTLRTTIANLGMRDIRFPKPANPKAATTLASSILSIAASTSAARWCASANARRLC